MSVEGRHVAHGGPLDRLSDLGDRGKVPASKAVLNAWIGQAEPKIGLQSSRIAWLIASTVVTAALQRAVGADGGSRFLLKGGTYLQHRLSLAGRATKDVDGLIRGDIDDFLQVLDEALSLPWGPLTLSRGSIEVIKVPGKVIKPRRFDVVVQLKGQAWRRIQVEISPEEAGAAAEWDILPVPNLKHFGLPNPEQLLGIAARFQVAQKIHACTDPHDPPTAVNDRARDVVDLLLLRDWITTQGGPTLTAIQQACIAVFDSRAAEARELNRQERPWPPTVVAHLHWAVDFAAAATDGLLDLTMDEAVAELNRWIVELAAASTATTHETRSPLGGRPDPAG